MKKQWESWAVGDVVRYLGSGGDDDRWCHAWMTIGSDYVVHEAPDEHQMILVLDDDGDEIGFPVGDFEFISSAAPEVPAAEDLQESWTPEDQRAFAVFLKSRFPKEMDSYAIQSLGSAWKDGQANAQPQPAAHLTIPGALEWDGDNGTHSADGESRAHSESRVAVRDAIAETLGDAYDCTRVWSAWQVGTMDQNDFSLIVEDDSRLDELAEAAIQAYSGAEVASLRAQLENTEQSRRSFFDLSQDLEKRLGKVTAFVQSLCDAAGSQPSVATGYLRDILDALSASDEPTKPSCESCGGWGHIETEDSAHDCPECGPSVIERAVEAGVMNAPKPYVAMTEAEADEFLSSFGGGSGNKAKRRIAAIQEAKQKTCIECDQPYCHGVCVERGDKDYDRDQAAKGGEQ